MIIQNELRVGNWLKYMKHNPFQVYCITNIAIGDHQSDWSVRDEFSWLQLKECEPIPLTEKILVMAGMLIAGPEGLKPFNTFADIGFVNICHIATKGDGNKIIGFDIHNQLFFICEYVHQLQNAHFAMTGKELELDLNS